VDVRSYELYLNYLLISNSKVNNFYTETGQCFPEREGSDRTQMGKGITGLISMVDLALSTSLLLR
jgi:hypothetical protein